MYANELVRLRRVEPVRDLEDRYRWMNDPEVARYLGMRPQRLSREEIRNYLERCAASAADVLEFAVETLDGRHIGGCTLRNFNHVARSAEFAIVIGEAGYRGRGYGTATTRLMVEVGFAALNLNRIWLTVHEANLAGIRAYEKAGFVREGLLRQYGFANGQYYNAYLMAILREEYEAGKGRAGG
jgi:RimJ/RimL family protein N-acetyltransferase